MPRIGKVFHQSLREFKENKYSNSQLRVVQGRDMAMPCPYRVYVFQLSEKRYIKELTRGD
jgi:hypothetical protein